MKNLRTLLVIIGVTVAIDLLSAAAVKSLMPSWKTAFHDNDHRIRSQQFHHGLLAGREVEDVWGGRAYRLAINSLGFKDRTARHVPLRGRSYRILFIGDSFTEGVGFPFEESFVGHVADMLFAGGVEVLNAGVVSYAPSAHYHKLRHFLADRGLRVDEVVALVDVSDPFDETTLYGEDKDGRLVVPPEKVRPLRALRHWLRDNSVIVRTFYLARESLRANTRRKETRIAIAGALNKEPQSVSDDEMGLYHTITLPGSTWSFDEATWNEFGKRGLEKAGRQMSRLRRLLEEMGIPLTLVIYPWPAHILLDPTGNRHSRFWKTWARREGVALVDLFDAFASPNPAAVVERYFIPRDVHWNPQGQRFVAESFLERFCGAISDCRAK